ncbi:hypothetical protein T484DRAFT_1981366 [Baffinella frigidus]|nr:hypothetical protein T484DRAFT_1981366 [Cryptophyta sp. CCMP2293]
MAPSSPKAVPHKPSHLNAITDGIHKKDEIRTHNARRLSARIMSTLADKTCSSNLPHPAASSSITAAWTEDVCVLSNNEWMPEDVGWSPAAWSTDENDTAEETALSQQLQWALSGEDRREGELGGAAPAWETAAPFQGLVAWEAEEYERGGEHGDLRHLLEDVSQEFISPADFYPGVSSESASDFDPYSTSSSDLEPAFEDVSRCPSFSGF